MRKKFEFDDFLRVSKRKNQNNTFIRRSLPIAIIIALSFAGLAIFVNYQLGITETNRKIANSLRLSLLANSELDVSFERALLLAIEAGKRAEALDTGAANDLVINRTLRDLLQVQGQPLFIGSVQEKPSDQLIWFTNDLGFISVEGSTLVGWHQTNLHTNEFEIAFNVDLTRRIRHASLSPDGTLLAIATEGETETVQIYSLAEKRIVHSLSIRNSVNYVDWHSNGQLLATAGENGFASVWMVDQNDVDLMFSLDQSASIKQVRWSPEDDHLLVLTGEVIKVWDMASTSVIGVVDNPGRRTPDAAWNSRGDRIFIINNQISANDGYTILVWDILKDTTQLLDHDELITSAVWDASGQHVFSATVDGNIQKWEVDSGTAVFNIQGHQGAINTIVFDATSELLISGGADQVARLWNPNTGAIQAQLAGHSDAIKQAAFDSDGLRLSSSSNDQTIRVWGLQPGSESVYLEGHADTVSSLEWSHSGDLLLSSSENGVSKIWDVSAGRHKMFFEQPETVRPIDSRWSPDDRYIAQALNNDHLVIWDAETGELHIEVEAHEIEVVQLEWIATDNNNAYQLVTAGVDGLIHLWEFSPFENISIQRIRSLNVVAEISAIAISPDNQRLAVAIFKTTGGDSITVWDISTGNELFGNAKHQNRVTQLDWSSDGNFLATGGDDSSIFILDGENGGLIQEINVHLQPITSLSWKPNAAVLASSGVDELTYAHDLNQNVSQKMNYTRRVETVVWHPQGDYLVTVNEKDGALFWLPDSGENFDIIYSKNVDMSHFKFQPSSNNLIAVGNRNGEIQLYLKSRADLLTTACQRIVRDLTLLEWDQFFSGAEYASTCS